MADLVNAAYRGEGGHTGWTSEAGLVAGQRISCAALQEELASSSEVSILILRDTQELLACIRLEKTKEARGRTRCYIGMLAVRPSIQNRGLGRVILQHAEAAGRAAGAQLARMTVVSVRNSLIAWYERQGYRRTGETERFPYEDPGVGTALRPDLEFVVLEKDLSAPSSA